MSLLTNQLQKYELIWSRLSEINNQFYDMKLSDIPTECLDLLSDHGSMSDNSTIYNFNDV